MTLPTMGHINPHDWQPEQNAAPPPWLLQGQKYFIILGVLLALDLWTALLEESSMMTPIHLCLPKKSWFKKIHY